MNIPLRSLMQKAWAGARRFGSTARAYLAAALRQTWAQERQAHANIDAMKARVRHSIATLASDLADSGRFMRDWYARQDAARTAEVLPFPVRRPVPAAPAPTRVAA